MNRATFLSSPSKQTWLLYLAGVSCAAAAAYTVLTSPPSVETYDLPKFSDPEATAYASAVGHCSMQYAIATHLGDASQQRQLRADFARLQPEAATIARRLPPAEGRRFTEFMSRCGMTIVDAEMHF